MGGVAISEQIPVLVKECLDNLAYERELLGLSREELQKATGVRADIIRAYEKGKGRPTRSKYNKLAAFFDWEAWE